MRFLLTMLFALSLGFTAAAANQNRIPPEATVADLDLNNYLGKWFEIARIPNSFQDNHPKKASACWGTTAEYRLLDNDRIDVLNTCFRTFPDGRSESEKAHGMAHRAQPTDNAKLKVNFTGIAFLRFLGIGDGDYWVLAVGPVNYGEYSWALVGSPRLDYGWILSREPEMSAEQLEEIFSQAESVGYRRSQFQINERKAP